MRHRLAEEILIMAVIVICFLVSLDVSFFQANYAARISYLKCSFRQSSPIALSAAESCCGSTCYYHASPRDSALAQFWDKAVTTPLSYLFYPIGSLFIK